MPKTTRNSKKKQNREDISSFWYCIHTELKDKTGQLMVKIQDLHDPLKYRTLQDKNYSLAKIQDMQEIQDK